MTNPNNTGELRLRGYKIRSYQNGESKEGRAYMNYSLTVPNEIAEALPEGITFTPKMTEDGLLYMPSSTTEEAIELPSWAKPNQNGKNGNSNAKQAEGAKTK